MGISQSIAISHDGCMEPHVQGCCVLEYWGVCVCVANIAPFCVVSSCEHLLGR